MLDYPLIVLVHLVTVVILALLFLIIEKVVHLSVIETVGLAIQALLAHSDDPGSLSRWLEVLRCLVLDWDPLAGRHEVRYGPRCKLLLP